MGTPSACYLLTCLLAALVLPCSLSVAAVVPVRLRCEYRINPPGIDETQPRLSWVLGPEHTDRQTEPSNTPRSVRQIAYRILVASSEALLEQDTGDLWDSGRTASDRSIQIEYRGKPLESRLRCHWKVRVWTARWQPDADADGAGQPTAWSQPAMWTMGLLEPRDWQAAWIKPVITNAASSGNTPAPLVRKVFTLADPPERAVAYVNVLGYYELYVNGQKAGDDVLAPAVSELDRRSLYRTYDIRKLLRKGTNCVGLWLGMGWNRSGPIARIQLEVSAGGQSAVVGTDRTWTCAPGTHTPLGNWTHNAMGGEQLDARRAIAGWSEPDCKANVWIPVQEAPAPTGVTTAQTCPPNRIGRVIPLAGCTAIGTNNTWELDFGTNLTGWLRLRLPRLKPGQRVVLHYADKRYQTPAGDETPAGRIRPGKRSQRVFGTPGAEVCYQTFGQIDEFISAGNPGEQFCSKFNYHGFRYVIVEGLAAPPERGDAEALLIESDLEPAGTFECSNDLFNRIHRMNSWTLRCLNLGGYMVDCPHRERLGYGDAQVSIESLVMNRDAAAFYGKWAVDWLDAQDPNTGEFPHTAPKSNGGGGPAWGGLACVLPWKLYQYYGDRRLLERAYDPIRRYVLFLESHSGDDGVLRYYGGRWGFIGDWVAPGRGLDAGRNWPPRPAAELFNNCYKLYLLDQLVRISAVLGRVEEAQRWRNRIDEIRPRIHDAFYDAQKQIYVLDEQAYQVMPLMTGIVPEDLRGTILKKLEDGILVKNHGHFDTGMLGTYFLIRYLQESGRSDLLYTLVNQTTYPGWGYMLSQGATTVWEQWNGYWSQIHSCFVSPGGWFYQGLAGIRPDESGPGFNKIVIRPAVAGLTWVRCSYNSMHGLIVSNWKREGNGLTMDVTIPANTTATVYVPAKAAASVTESGRPAGSAEGVTFLRMEDNAAVYAVRSGTYRFRSTLFGSG